MNKKQFYEYLLLFCKKYSKKYHRIVYKEIPKELNILGFTDGKEVIVIDKEYENTEKGNYILQHEQTHVLLNNHTMIFHIVAKQPTHSQMDRGKQTLSDSNLFNTFLKWYHYKTNDIIDFDWINKIFDWTLGNETI